MRSRAASLVGTYCSDMPTLRSRREGDENFLDLTSEAVGVAPGSTDECQLADGLRSTDDIGGEGQPVTAASPTSWDVPRSTRSPRKPGRFSRSPRRPTSGHSRPCLCN